MTVKINNDTTTLPVVNLTANSVTATFTATASPSPLAFGHVTVTTNATLPLTVTNTGNSTLTGLSYTFGGGAPQPFSRPGGNAGGTCGATLAAGASCTVNVRFTPTGTITYSKTLTVSANNGTVTTGSPVTLSGTGDAPPLPGTPTGGSSTRGGFGGQITANLTWTAPSFASSYDVQWSTSSAAIAANTGNVITNATSSTSYTFNGGANGLATGTTVFFKVRAVNITGPGGWSTSFSSTVR